MCVQVRYSIIVPLMSFKGKMRKIAVEVNEMVKKLEDPRGERVDS